MSTAALNALAALRARFSPVVLAQVGALPYPEALYRARERRARSLAHHLWQETEESARETPIIITLDAFIREREAAA